MSKRKDFATALLGVITAMTLWLTILSRETLIGTPIVYTPFHEIFAMWKSIQRGGITGNFLGNIVLFIPIGLLLPIVIEKHKWYWAMGAGFSFSCIIEVIQLVSSRGCFDPDDMILNTLGTAIGYGLYCCMIHKRIVDTKQA